MSPTVVTGIGVVAPNGLGAGDYWSATLRAESGIGPITRFDASSYPARLAGEVPGFDPREHVPSRLLPQTDHMTRLSLAAARWALRDAGADPATLPPYGTGVVTASSAGGFDFGQRELQNLWRRGRRFVSAYQSFAWFYAVNTGQISIQHRTRGPGAVVVGEQAGGIDAVALARRHVVRGVPLVVTGAVDSSLCPWGWVGQLASGRLSTSAEADRAYLPFDLRAGGHVAGEGGAILVLEDLDSARARGAGQIYGEIAGHGATFDPAPGSGGQPQLRRAAELALVDAGVTPADVDVVFADAAGTPALDLVEATALVDLFGAYGVPVTAPKTMTGRLCAGGAPLDLAAAVLSIRDQVIPPTANVTALAEGCALDLVVGAPRPAVLTTVLVLARGYGGFNAAMVVRRVGDEPVARPGRIDDLDDGRTQRNA